MALTVTDFVEKLWYGVSPVPSYFIFTPVSSNRLTMLRMTLVAPPGSR